MDFDPYSKKWSCCCCKLSCGLQILAATEMLLTITIAIVTTVNVVRSTTAPSYFEICLILTMSTLAVTSAMLIVGINRFNVSLMYPTLLARMLLIIFVQVFGVSTVVAPHRTHSRWESYREKTEKQEPESNVALRLVMLVFAMLIITVIVLYCIYLVVRCIQYVKYYCRMKERRDSLIQASMIHPDAGSRRTSSLA